MQFLFVLVIFVAAVAFIVYKAFPAARPQYKALWTAILGAGGAGLASYWQNILDLIHKVTG